MSFNGINHNFWNGSKAEYNVKNHTETEDAEYNVRQRLLKERLSKLRDRMTEDKVKPSKTLSDTAGKDNLYDTIVTPLNELELSEGEEVPELEQGEHGTMLGAYKAAYEEKCKMEQKAISYIDVLKDMVQYCDAEKDRDNESQWS